MASINAIKKLAEALLSAAHLGILKEVIQEHFDVAIAAKNKARILALSELLSLVDAVEKKVAQ